MDWRTNVSATKKFDPECVSENGKSASENGKSVSENGKSVGENGKSTQQEARRTKLSAGYAVVHQATDTFGWKLERHSFCERELDSSG